ncbi:hypothetical protein GCM10010873_04430 [Cypionkella aquatica]|uniref:Uncharacterized protein n=1 Tax=Cypionkella aquatica TaxID=1756042 RepID=A0AA37TTJ5_9RHOB|nr:hypothetical protein [Cypionkella aquatica]GLS85470.1 hypothetical protein GCM10010873_04430 [Cypionkella aquatica]
MQVIRSLEQIDATPVGLGIRVMLVTQGNDASVLPRRLAGLGGKVEMAEDLFVGLEAVIDDPAGYGLFVIDCDAIGGIDAGRRAQGLMVDVVRRVPIILISSECSVQEFPEERGQAVVLRGPASGLSLRVGFEHALRDRLAARMI